MSSPNQKHTVSTDALDTLGTADIPEGSGRDAIHLAVEPVVAGHRLEPGEHIGIYHGLAMASKICKTDIGIVDPFLDRPVEIGERFWLVVHPRTITSLRHVWSHPSFPETSDMTSEVSGSPSPLMADERTRQDSEAWLRAYASRCDISYAALLEVAQDDSGYVRLGRVGDDDDYYSCRKEDEYIHFSGTDAHGDIDPELWDHVQNVVGKPILVRPTFFSCSC